MSSADFELVDAHDARKTPVRVAVVQEETRPAVELTEEDLVMTFPHLVVRELIALIAFSLAVVLIALLFDAPLEQVANPLQTPNPAKAPWYFLGLQELLHYYPPLVSGVILPGLVILALVVVPYFEINLRREAFWETDRDRKLIRLGVVTAAVCILFLVSGAHVVWPVIVPTLVIAGLMAWPALSGMDTPWRRFVGTRSLAFWAFSWFLACLVTLTIIGVFFRGPGWTFTLPWIDGVYY
jgi:quinol-cytochrome oxidoreductase complex cytochrome b subunit